VLKLLLYGKRRMAISNTRRRLTTAAFINLSNMHELNAVHAARRINHSCAITHLRARGDGHFVVRDQSKQYAGRSNYMLACWRASATVVTMMQAWRDTRIACTRTCTWPSSSLLSTFTCVYDGDDKHSTNRSCVAKHSPSTTGDAFGQNYLCLMFCALL